MKQKLLFALVAFSLFLTSCGSSDGLNGNWKFTDEFEAAPRGGAVSFTIDNDVYIGSGYDGKDCLSTFYKYNLQDGWLRIADLPGTPRKEAVAFSINGKGYVGMGVDEEGDDEMNDFYVYDPALNTWEKAPNEVINTQGNYPLPARQGAVAFTIGKIAYVGTGYGRNADDDDDKLKDYYKFDGTSWVKIAYSGKSTVGATAFVINDKAYVISGENSLEYVWEYDPKSITETHNGWTSKKKLNSDNSSKDVQRIDGVSFVINNKGYIVTGKGNGYSRETWEYDPTKDDWVERTSLENEISSREDAIAFTINNKGFIATGNAAGTYLKDVWEFEPTVERNDDDN